MAKHPWQTGPIELLSYANKLTQEKNELDMRIAFLLLDVGVETLFKTYLLYEVTDAEMSPTEKNKVLTGNFPELLIGVKKAAVGKIIDSDLEHVKFFHKLRNKLYHEGIGFTITSKNVFEYAELAKKLVKELLAVDLLEPKKVIGKPKINPNVIVIEKNVTEKTLSDEQLKNAIKSVGKKTFVEYYEYFQDFELSAKELTILLIKQEHYSLNSCHTKISNSRSIIKSGRAEEVLVDISESTSPAISDDIKAKARELLKTFF
jgi:hypothetical protein